MFCVSIAIVKSYNSSITPNPSLYLSSKPSPPASLCNHRSAPVPTVPHLWENNPINSVKVESIISSLSCDFFLIPWLQRCLQILNLHFIWAFSLPQTALLPCGAGSMMVGVRKDSERRQHWPFLWLPAPSVLTLRHAPQNLPPTNSPLCLVL